MKLHILSDLHLEFGSLPVPETDADVIIAAGDIHLQDHGVAWLTQFNRPVVYVCGNHEFWQGEYYETQQKIRNACQGTQIYFLERQSVTLNGVRFLGTTLWTDYAEGNQWLMEDAESRINDFKYIRLKDGTPFNAAFIRQEHEHSLEWLKTEMAASDAPTVIVTHHAPTTKSWHKEPSSALQFAYCNRLDEWAGQSGARLWVHGHTHGACEYQVGETPVVCNPRGYYDNGLVEAFEPGKTIELALTS